MKITKPNITTREWEADGKGRVDVPLEPSYIEFYYEYDPEAIANAKIIACVPEMLDKLLEFRYHAGVVELLIKVGCTIEK